MHIALVIPGFSQSADDWAIPSLQNLAVYLAQKHQVSVFSLRYPANGRYYFGGLTHYALGAGTRGGISLPHVIQRAVQAIVAVHKRDPIDVLHANWLDEAAMTAVLAGRLIKRPAVASVGGGELLYLADINYGMQGSRWRRWLIKTAVRGLDGVAVGSDYQREICLQYISPHKLHYAPRGVDVDRFRPQPEPDWTQPTVVQAASLIPVKNQVLLFEVMQQVLTAVPQARLRLAGLAPFAEHKHKLREAYPDLLSASWVQKVPYLEMSRFYEPAHVYVQTSRHESQGMAVLEGMATGIPVLGTPVGVLPQWACLPATDDVAMLSEQVIAVLKRPSVYNLWRQQAYEIVAEHYAMPVAAARYVALYEQVMDY